MKEIIKPFFFTLNTIIQMFNAINFKRHTQGQQIQYLKDVYTICFQAYLPYENIPIALFSLENHLEQLDISFKKPIKNTKTKDLIQKDQARINAFRCLFHLGKAYTLHPNPQKIEGAKYLLKVIKHYGGMQIPYFDYQLKTNVMYHLGEKLKADELGILSSLEIQTEISFLIVSNQEFNALWIERLHENTQESLIRSTTQLLPQAIQSFRDLKNQLNALLCLNTNDDLSHLIEELNQLTHKYRSSLKRSPVQNELKNKEVED